jgi:hypothetical protein
MTGFDSLFPVMAVLVTAIHVFLATSKSWMAGTSPAMTLWICRRNPKMLSLYSARPFGYRTRRIRLV